MIIFSIILGILLIICGVSCVMTPMQTLISTGYFIGIMFFVNGLAGIIRNFSWKVYGLDFALNILNVILGVICIFRPGTTLAIDAILVYMVSFWLIIQGCIRVGFSFTVKKLGPDSGWVFELLMGILSAAVGIFSLFHPYITAISVGIMIGIYFVEAGIQTIVLSVFAGKVRKEVQEAVEQSGI